MKKIIFLPVLALFILSCQEPLTHAVQTNDMLELLDLADYENAISNSNSLTEDQLDQWEKGKSFVSYRSVVRKAYTELESIETEEAWLKFKESYSDVFHFENDVVHPKIDVRIYQSIVNREGFYLNSGKLTKVTASYIITTSPGNYSSLRFLDDSQIKKIENDQNFSIFRYANSTNESARTNDACGTNISASYYDNPKGCRNDREVFIEVKSWVESKSSNEGDWRQPRVQILIYGTIRNGWCSWSRYNTQLDRRNCSFTLMAWSKNQNGSYTPTSYYRTPPNSSSDGDQSELTWDYPIGDNVLNQLITPSAFTSFYGEGKSRGVGENWAVINCQ